MILHDYALWAAGGAVAGLVARAVLDAALVLYWWMVK